MLLVCAIINAATCLQTLPMQGMTQAYYSHGHELAPEPREHYHAALEHCINSLLDKCLKQICDYKSSERTKLCKECSDQLLQMVKACSKKLSNTLSYPDVLLGSEAIFVSRRRDSCVKKQSTFRRLLGWLKFLFTCGKHWE